MLWAAAGGKHRGALERGWWSPLPLDVWFRASVPVHSRSLLLIPERDTWELTASGVSPSACEVGMDSGTSGTSSCACGRNPQTRRPRTPRSPPQPAPRGWVEVATARWLGEWTYLWTLRFEFRVILPRREPSVDFLPAVGKHRGPRELGAAARSRGPGAYLGAVISLLSCVKRDDGMYPSVSARGCWILFLPLFSDFLTFLNQICHN